MLRIYLCLLLFCSTLAENVDTYDEETATDEISELEHTQITTINKLVDMILNEARHFIEDHNFDPMKLPDIVKGISYKPILVSYNGDLKMTKGWLQGASGLYRDGDVNLEYNNRVSRFRIPLVFHYFHFDFDYLVNVMRVGPTGHVGGKINDIHTEVVIEMDFKKLRVRLADFQIAKLGNIKVKFEGNSLADWLINLLSGAITTIFHGIIHSVARSIVAGNLNTILDTANKGLMVLKNTNGDKL